jgi:hypothetical protein
MWQEKTRKRTLNGGLEFRNDAQIEREVLPNIAHQQDKRCEWKIIA